MAVLQHGDAGRIIATVFQPFEAVHDNRGRVARPDVANYSTHVGGTLRLLRVIPAGCLAACRIFVGTAYEWYFYPAFSMGRMT